MRNVIGWSEIADERTGDSYGLVTNYGQGVGRPDRFEIWALSETHLRFPAKRMEKSTFSGRLRGGGSIVWANEGLVHRPDGPAIVNNDSARWFLRGVEYTLERYWLKQRETQHAEAVFTYVCAARDRMHGAAVPMSESAHELGA